MNVPAIDRPDVVAEVTRLFHAYEQAFMTNDVETLIDFFWDDARLTRYGVADRQLGMDEMRAFRRATPTPSFTRRIENLRVTAFCGDCAVALAEFLRSDTLLHGFQSQTWARVGAGGTWKIVSAHVSMVPFEADEVS